MRILFVRPYYTFLKHELPIRINEPLGLEYLASVIKDDHEVSIYDCIIHGQKKLMATGDLYRIGSGVDDILKIVQKFNPDIVGIHASFYSQALNTREISKSIKEKFSKIKIIIGGAYPSSYGAKTLKEDPNIDIAVIGEGEVVLKNLLDSNLKNLFGIKGIIFRNNNEIIENDLENPIDDLDGIPFPERSLIDMGDYNETFGLPNTVRTKFKQFLMKNKRSRLLYYWFYNIKNFADKLPQASIITSRSCINNCTFCAIKNVWGPFYRMRSADNLLEEIFFLVNKYNIKFLNIVDDNFTVSKKRTLEVCDGIIKNKLDIIISMSSGVFLPSLDEEVLDALKNAGLREIVFAIENGNQDVLRNIIKKNIDLEHAKEIIKYSKSIGLKTRSFFILGYPGETKETMIETILYAYNSGLDSARFHIYQPFPNTEIYKSVLKKGYLMKESDLRYLRMRTEKPLIKTEHFGPQDVLDIKEIADKIITKRDLDKYESKLRKIVKRPPQ